MQGRLRNAYIAATVHTCCAHCGQPMVLRIDSDLAVATDAEGCRPLCFVPEVDLFGLEDECIVDAF
ncbi:MAG: hypothetical protein HY911_11380 [Desulfobacterales bacterium]|nr:hypothetical protein [Desulfobacterales bacterium]